MATPWQGMKLSVEDEITIAVHRALAQDAATRGIFSNAIYRRHLVIAQLFGAAKQVIVSGVQVDERLGFSALVKGEHAVAMLACAEWFSENLTGDQPSYASLLSHWRTVVERELNADARLRLTGTSKMMRWETVILAPEGVEGSATFLAAGQRVIFPYDVTAVERLRRAA